LSGDKVTSNLRVKGVAEVINNPRLLTKAIPAIIVVVALFLSGCWPGIIVKERVSEDRSVVITLHEAAKKDFQAGRYEEALSAFKIILLEYPDYTRTPSVRYDMARAYYSMGDFHSAATEALKWLEAYPDNSIKGDMLLLLGDSYKAIGDWPEAFRWWLNAAMEPSSGYQSGKRQEDIDLLIIDLINRSSSSDLKKMAEYGADSVYITNIYNRLARLFLKENRLEEAKDFAMLLVRASKEQQWVTIGRELLDEIYMAAARYEDMSGGSIVKIGCLLPLSGPYALYGREILNGIQLGVDIFNKSEGDQGLELVIRDTKGSIEDTVAGVEELVQKEKVMAIMGPLASATATMAVKKAQELGIPIITFTQKDGITREGDMVFRNYLTPSKEVDAVVNKSIKEMGMKRFGIFYPDNTYGRFMMNLFWDKVEKLGGQITAVESYKTDDTDFTDGIRKMVGLYYPRTESTIQKLKMMKMIENEEEGLGDREVEDKTADDTGQDMEDILEDEGEALEDIDFDRYDAEHSASREVEEELEPIVDFDAVFIPDNYQQVALIAPQFPFNNVFNLPFLGTSLWLSDEILETASRYIQGSLFPVGFFIDNNSETVKRFVESYEDNFGSEPTILAANGYDTIRLIKDILDKNVIKTRTDFQKALSGNTFRGVTGEISFDSQGEVQKEPFLLTVYGRGFHPLSRP
jgi:branched-chain amino acid transport system substrate-binding protein